MSIDKGRITIKSVVDKQDQEVEEVIDHGPLQWKGVEVELASFFDAFHGAKSDPLGDPTGALRDVAFIEAALNSEGNLVSLIDLVG